MCGRGSLSGSGITPQGVREAAGSLRAACVAGMSARQATARSVRQVGVCLCDMRTGACFFFFANLACRYFTIRRGPTAHRRSRRSRPVACAAPSPYRIRSHKITRDDRMIAPGMCNSPYTHTHRPPSPLWEHINQPSPQRCAYETQASTRGRTLPATPPLESLAYERAIDTQRHTIPARKSHA